MTRYSPPQFAAAARYAGAWERAPSLRPKTQLHIAANRKSLILLAFMVRGRDGSSLLTPSVVTMLLGFWLVLQAPDADGSKIELDQSEPAMRDLSRSADAHRVVPVG